MCHCTPCLHFKQGEGVHQSSLIIIMIVFEEKAKQVIYVGMNFRKIDHIFSEMACGQYFRNSKEMILGLEDFMNMLEDRSTVFRT